MDIRTYISDSLLRLSGASDATVVDFIEATARSAKSVDSLSDKLVPFLDGGGVQVQRFCAELWGKVGGGGNSAGREKTKHRREDGAKKRYALVEMEDDILGTD